MNRASMWAARLVVGFAAAAVVVIGVAGCEEAKDSPEVAQRKVECRKLSEHIFRITPESRKQLENLPEDRQRTLLGEMIAKVSVEDVELCTKADPKVIACMQQAPDVAAVRACIPPAHN